MELRKAVDNLYLYDPEFEAGAGKFVREVGGSTSTQKITTWAEVKAAIEGHTGVKFLVFDTHGMPGSIYLASGQTIQGMDFMVLLTNLQFLANDARVLFLGCNIAEGTEGDTFLKDAGKYLLKGKGGTLGGTTVSNMTFQIGSFSSEAYMTPLSFGRLKVKRYDQSGTEVGSMTVDRHSFAR